MIELKNLCKTYSLSDGSVEALKDVSLTIPDGDIYGIIGMSGAGKSTLVRCINLLERPTSGSVIIDGRDLTSMTEKELRQERQSITMIFQGFNLLMQKNCLRNVCFPLELAGVKKAEAAQKAQSLLELVGLGDKAAAYPAQLSGGQQQRVGIAAAMLLRPGVLFADEPTAALDVSVQKQVLEELLLLRKTYGTAIVLVAHTIGVIGAMADRVLVMQDGRTVEYGETQTVLHDPQASYTRMLLSAVPRLRRA